MKELTLKDLEKLDVIEVTDEQIEKIRQWCLNNKKIILKEESKIKYILNNIAIRISQQGRVGIENDYFKSEKKDIYRIINFNILNEKEISIQSGQDFASVFKSSNEIKNPFVLTYKCTSFYTLHDAINFTIFNEVLDLNRISIENDYVTRKEKELFYRNYNMKYDNFIISNVESDIRVFYSLLIYINFNQEFIIKKTKTYSKKIQSKKDKRAGKKPKVKLIKQNIIKLNTDHLPMPTEEEIKHYERHMLGWTVRGHWRTYQSGKKVWIKPHVRGDKDNVEGKVYEI